MASKQTEKQSIKQLVVVGIGTDVGKTYASAVLVAGLNAQYWKPIQAGVHPTTDTLQLQQWLNLPSEHFIPSAYEFQLPESPHSAAEAEGKFIELENLTLPDTENNLIIEGAGGVMVPLNHHLWFVDVLVEWQLPVVLVIDGYLGCINHSLLTWEALMSRNIRIAGLIFNRVTNMPAFDYIAKATGAKVLGYLPNQKMTEFDEFKACFDTHIQF